MQRKTSPPGARIPQSPHGKDLRKGRWSLDGQIYLVTTTTHDRNPLFSDWRCGRLVVHSIAKEAGAQSLAFVVMPDHLHWLLQLKPNSDLSRVMQSIKSVSAHRINKYLRRKEPVWQDGFHDHAIRRDEDVVKVARYVVANPLRAKLVESVGDYALWDAIWL